MHWQSKGWNHGVLTGALWLLWKWLCLKIGVHDHFPYEDSHMEVIGLYQMNVVNPTKNYAQPICALY
jgi:hypothetical protein